MSQTAQRRARSEKTPISTSIGRGIGLSTAAYVVGYIITIGFNLVDGVPGQGEVKDDVIYQITAIGGMNPSDHPPGWQIHGWSYYNAHNVKIKDLTTVTDTFNPYTIEESVNTLTREGPITSTISAPGYYLVPALILLLAGALLYNWSESNRRNLAMYGSFILGYAALMAGGVMLFTYKAEVSSVNFDDVLLTIHPELWMSLIAGVGYPLLFGVLGGRLLGDFIFPSDTKNPNQRRQGRRDHQSYQENHPAEGRHQSENERRSEGGER